MGCSTTSNVKTSGSKVWYKERMAEIETSYQNKEISKTEYLNLKTETDKVRAIYKSESSKGGHVWVHSY